MGITLLLFLKKNEIIEKIRALIHVDSIECNAFLINRALTIWEENTISYVDSYILAVAELGDMTLYTYDKKLKAVATVIAKEP